MLAGGRIVDGGGGPADVGDVWIEDGRIGALTPVAERHGDAEVVAVQGLAVAPGFIDSHSHADNAAFLPDADLSKLTQGVTTEVVGNCGFSLAPRPASRAADVKRYLSLLFDVDTLGPAGSSAEWLGGADNRGYAVNMVPLVGHGTLRAAVIGLENRPAGQGELRAMGDLLERALDEGAVGLSSGLIYRPGTYATTDELAAIAARLHGRPAVYASHIRSEGAGLLQALDEALAIGRDAGAAVHVSHLKAAGAQAWGLMGAALALLDRARQSGQRVTQDVYPYTASSTMLVMALPATLRHGGDDEILARLARPEAADAVRSGLAQQADGRGRVDDILVAWTPDHRHEGQRLGAIGAALGTDGAGALVRVLLDASLRASMISFSMREEDLRAALAHPLTAIGSDGAPPGLGGSPDPRLWGTFPRVLGIYAREQGTLTLEDAVRRMTSLPADIFHLPEIGRLRAGARADITVFDPEAITDRATYVEPTRPAHGVRHVLIGGAWALRDGVPLGLRLGRRLRPAL